MGTGELIEEGPLTSDFSAARSHLDRAYYHLRGRDETSLRARDALDILIEAIATAEHTRPPGEILQFPSQVRTSQR